MKFNLKAMALAAAMMATAAAPKAEAAMILNLTDLTTAPAVNVASATNLVQYFGTVGDFTVTATVATSNVPGGAFASLDIVNLAIVNNGAAQDTLTIEAIASGFTLPFGPNLVLSSSASTSNSSRQPGSVNHEGFIEDASGFATNSCTLDAALASDNCNGADTPFLRDGGPFQLRSLMTFTLAAGGYVNTTANVRVDSVVPEPASMTLVGLGLLGAAFAARRRRS
jgi:hypothetical protein